VAPYVHGSIVSRAPNYWVVSGDSLSTPAWLIGSWSFTVTSATLVRWLGGGVADTSTLTVGRDVWVEVTNQESLYVSQWLVADPGTPADVIFVQGP